MESTTLADSSKGPHAGGELIVQSGRQKGTRRPLKSPVTLIGRAEGCDIRLNVDDILPVHCAIIMGSDGPQLRSWCAESTLVNDEPVETCHLHDGDQVRIGPFRFAVSWIASNPADHEVLRIQAAGVVAHQTALVEQEVRLENRQAAFAQQQTQLSEHLEAKRLQVIELQNALSEARAAFRKERAEHESHLEMESRSLAEARDEAERQRHEAESERARLNGLRRRFVKRWKRHWSDERKRLEKQSAAVRHGQEILERERASFAKERSRFANECAAERKQFEEKWSKLEIERRAWREEQRRVRAEVEQRAETIDAEARRFQAREQNLAVERRKAEQALARLRAEAEGLELRVWHGREALKALEHEKATFGMAPSALPLPGDDPADQTNDGCAPPTDVLLMRTHLQQMATELAEQRAALAEQCERLALARETWREEEQTLVREMEIVTAQVNEREQSFSNREAALAERENKLRSESERLHELRQQFGTMQVRLQADIAAWRGERERDQVATESSMRAAAHYEQKLEELVRRWTEARREEEEALAAEHARCEGLRRDWSEQIATLARRTTDLHEQQRRVAEQALVLEQGRQELMEVVDNPTVAEKRLERLRRHVQGAYVRSERFFAERRQALEAEAEALRELFERAGSRIREAARMEAEYAARALEAERKKLLADQNLADRAEMERVWNVQRESFESELHRLREEIERLTLPTDEGNEPATLPFPRAA